MFALHFAARYDNYSKKEKIKDIVGRYENFLLIRRLAVILK